MSLPGLPWTIAEAARRFADRTAYVTPLGWSLSYADVDRISDEVAGDEAGAAELRRFLETFFSTYARFGPVLRAWMEGNVEDRETSRLGVVAFTDIATALGSRMRDAGARGDVASISALMALLERFAYFLVSRELEFDTDTLFDTVTRVVHRGFFGAPLAA